MDCPKQGIVAEWTGEDRIDKNLPDAVDIAPLQQVDRLLDKIPLHHPKRIERNLVRDKFQGANEIFFEQWEQRIMPRSVGESGWNSIEDVSAVGALQNGGGDNARRAAGRNVEEISNEPRCNNERSTHASEYRSLYFVLAAGKYQRHGRGERNVHRS